MHKQVDIPIIDKHFKDINPIICGWGICRSTFSYGPASREFYLMHYVVSGKGIYKSNNITHHLSTSEIFLGYPNELMYYEANSDDPWEYVWIGFKGESADDLIRQAGFTKEKPFVNAGASSYIFNSIRELEKTNISREILLNGLIYELLSNLIENNSQENKIVNNKKTYVRISIDYIKNNYSSHITIQGIADMLNLDRRYFFKIFKNITGKSPQAYLVDYRLEKAEKLLLKGYSVSNTARSVGYNDFLSFSKIFKSKHNICPSKYLQSK